MRLSCWDEYVVGLREESGKGEARGICKRRRDTDRLVVSALRR